MLNKKRKINKSKTSKQKSSPVIITEPPTLCLPNNNDILKAYINKNKTKLTEHVVNSIECAVTNKLGVIEIFTFKDSNFVITVPQKEFLPNIDNIYQYYITSEKYELCPRIVKLQNALKNINHET